jgi:putative ABC transport system substrate-binding protein
VRRREFIELIVSAAAAWPLAARAQQQRMRRIGVLMPLPADDPEAKARIVTLQKALELLGWSLERDLRIDVRFSPGASQLYQPLAQELLALKPDVVVAVSTAVAVTMHQQTHTIPIVFVPVLIPWGLAWLLAWRNPVAMSLACSSMRRASQASGWRCSKRSRRA